MTHMLTYVISLNHTEISVELFTVLNVQLVMTWLLIYQNMELLVQVTLVIVLPALFFGLPVIRIDVAALSAYHAGLNSKLRSSILDDWISAKTQVVVATVAFGYGHSKCKVDLFIFRN